MIHFNEVQKSLGSRRIINDLTLFLPKTSYTLVCGESLSGKTTLMRMIMAYEKPDQGTLTVDDIDIGTIPDSRIPFLRRQVGLIATSPALLEERTVVENISMPLQLGGFDPDVKQSRLETLLEIIGLQDDKDLTVERLGKSERQLVSAARAIIHKPPVVLADEPFEDIDENSANQIIDLLNKVNSDGATVLVTCRNNDPTIQRLTKITTRLTLKDGGVTQYDYNEGNLN